MRVREREGWERTLGELWGVTRPVLRSLAMPVAVRVSLTSLLSWYSRIIKATFGDFCIDILVWSSLDPDFGHRNIVWKKNVRILSFPGFKLHSSRLKKKTKQKNLNLSSSWASWAVNASTCLVAITLIMTFCFGPTVQNWHIAEIEVAGQKMSAFYFVSICRYYRREQMREVFSSWSESLPRNSFYFIIELTCLLRNLGPSDIYFLETAGELPNIPNTRWLRRLPFVSHKIGCLELPPERKPPQGEAVPDTC